MRSLAGSAGQSTSAGFRQMRQRPEVYVARAVAGAAETRVMRSPGRLFALGLVRRRAASHRAGTRSLPGARGVLAGAPCRSMSRVVPAELERSRTVAGPGGIPRTRRGGSAFIAGAAGIGSTTSGGPPGNDEKAGAPCRLFRPTRDAATVADRGGLFLRSEGGPHSHREMRTQRAGGGERPFAPITAQRRARRTACSMAARSPGGARRSGPGRGGARPWWRSSAASRRATTGIGPLEGRLEHRGEGVQIAVGAATCGAAVVTGSRAPARG